MIHLWQSVVLGIVEGVTEFLPVSSTGHLTFVERLMGLKTDDTGVTGFTAVIQMGAILASVWFFRADVVRITGGWLRGLRDSDRRDDVDYRMGWYVIAATVPILVVGFALRHVIKDDLRSLWAVVGGLIAWSFVIAFAEAHSRRTARVRASADVQDEDDGQGGGRDERQTTLTDAVVIGLVQCIALVPGVSRSGATISAGLLRGLDRLAATRLSFFLAIPALLAAGLYELKDAIHGHVGALPTLVGTVVSFVVAYASIAWLLRFVAHHSIARFVPYRLVLGVVIALVVATGGLSAVG